MYLKDGELVVVIEDDYKKVTAKGQYGKFECKVVFSAHNHTYAYMNTTTGCIVTKFYSTLGDLIMQERSNFQAFYDNVEIEIKYNEM